MKENLTRFMLNEKKSSSLRYIIYTILFLLILEQIYTLSSFVYKYCYTYDYGKLMEKTCENSYIEYETDRFQISKNIMDMVLQNDNNNSNFNVIILAISITVVLFICFMFVFIFLDSISGGAFLSSTINFGKSPKGSILIQSSFNQLKLFMEMTLLDKLVLILKILLAIYIVLLVPVTIGIKYMHDFDISPFVNRVENMIVHSIFLAPILFFTYVNAKDSVFFSIMFFILFFVAFFYILTMIDIYKKHGIINKEANKYDNSDNDILKELQFSITYFDDIDNTDSNIVGRFLKEIFGFNDVGFVANLRNGSLPISTNIVNFKGLIFFTIIVIVVLALFYFILSYKPDGMELYGLLEAGSFDANAIFYLALVPFIVLFVVLLTVVATKEFNTYINKYILYKPNNLYKRHINTINREFNKIIENDSANIQNNSVCANITNAINMTLYSNIFHKFQGDLFTPEFDYSSICEKGDYIEYHKMRQYDFDKYINRNNVNIFYDDGKCSSVNNDLISAVMKASIVPYKDSITDSDYIAFKDAFINKLKFAINNIKNKLTYTGDRALQLTNEYKANNDIKEITPKGESYTFDQETIVLISIVADEYIKYIKSIHTYIITILQALIRCNNIDDFTTEGYDSIIDNLDDTIRNSTNGNYSLNIKKGFVNKFSLITRQLFLNINKMLSNRIRKSEDNNKLTKYIIKNYNFYQTESYRKYLNDVFTIIDGKGSEDSILPQSDNIPDVKAVLLKLYENIGELNIATNESVIEKKKLELKDNLTLLNSEKRAYEDSYKNLLSFNENDYYTEMVHDYNIEYIDRNIKLHNNLYRSIGNRDKIGIFSYDFKFDNSSSNNVFDVNAYSVSKNELGINFDVYSASYDSIRGDFENKYNVLFNIANNRYKIEEEKHNYRELERDQEEYSRDVLKMANNTSTNIYTLFSVYFIALFVANSIK